MWLNSLVSLHCLLGSDCKSECQWLWREWKWSRGKCCPLNLIECNTSDGELACKKGMWFGERCVCSGAWDDGTCFRNELEGCCRHLWKAELTCACAGCCLMQDFDFEVKVKCSCLKETTQLSDSFFGINSNLSKIYPLPRSVLVFSPVSSKYSFVGWIRCSPMIHF